MVVAGAQWWCLGSALEVPSPRAAESEREKGDHDQTFHFSRTCAVVGTGVAGMEKFGEISGKDFFATAAESAPTAPSEPQKNELKKKAN